jgi:hypothetical protein
VPVHAPDPGLGPDRLQAVPQGAQQGGRALPGAARPREGGFDAARHRQGICHAGLLSTMPEQPRNRKAPKRGRKRLCKAARPARRLGGERPWAGEEQGTRVLCRCEHSQQRPYGMQWLASTGINLRPCCGA